MTIAQEIQKLSPSATVEVYQIDLALYGGPILYFFSGANEVGNELVWQGISYTKAPIIATGFDKTSQGTIPRPSLKISDVNGIMGATIRTFGEFIGCSFIRKRTFARFLDAVNFPGNVNPEADPNQYMADELWSIDRKAYESGDYIEFELASPLDMEGVKVPRRQIIQNTCTWVYRGGDCGYAGDPVAKEDGTPTTDPAQDVCGKRLSDCKLRWEPLGMPLTYGGFPAAGLIR